jgi:hypothetical protein
MSDEVKDNLFLLYHSYFIVQLSAPANYRLPRFQRSLTLTRFSRLCRHDPQT